MFRFKPVSAFFAMVCVSVIFMGEAAAELCAPSALGLQAYAGVYSNDAGCVVNGTSTSPTIKEASSASAYAQAATTYGVNSASVFGNLPLGQGTNDAAAWSIWADTITITGGTGTGKVSFSTHLSGTFTDHTQTNYTLAVIQGAGGNFTGASTLGIFSAIPGGTSNFSIDVVLPYTFTYDVSFTLTSWLVLSAHLDANCCGGREAMLPFSADFSHTAILDTVILPTGATLISGSGSSYPANVAAIPEPETYAMLLAGLGLISWTARQRKQRT